MAAKNEHRCWPGYEPVKGKPEHSQGSCRPKAESKLTTSEKEFRKKRRKQLDEWQAEHPKTRKSAAQHLRAAASPKPKATKRVNTTKKRAASGTKRRAAKGQASSKST